MKKKPEFVKMTNIFGTKNQLQGDQSILERFDTFQDEFYQIRRYFRAPLN